MASTPEIIARTAALGASNYNPLPVVIARAEGVWVYDTEDRPYLDMLSAYSALNQGHRHPHILAALRDQADRVTLTSRAFYSEPLAAFYEQLSAYTGKPRILPMNTGAEAVETAIKAARRWAYRHRGVPDGQAEILVCEGNFHGRTLAATSCSSEPGYRHQFGPLMPGFRLIPYGDLEALRHAITPHTAALLIEPIQGEAGIRLPPPGYLRQAAELCRNSGILLIADEIQTGFGRTGARFACDAEGVVPDAYLLGKALGGGVLPVSAVAADDALLGVFEPGSHGSTFGGNPLACAVAVAALEVITAERLADRSRELGGYLLGELQRRLPVGGLVREIRGRGLFIGVELSQAARPYCEALMELGLLCKETHEHVIRLAPPLTIRQEELDWALERLCSVLGGASSAAPETASTAVPPDAPESEPPHPEPV